MIADYDDEVLNCVERLELINNKTLPNDYIHYRKVFDKLWAFNKKLIHKKAAFERQGRRRFYYPNYTTWATIITMSYLSILGIIVANGVFPFSFYMLLGLPVALLILWVVLRVFLFPLKSPFCPSSIIEKACDFITHVLLARYT